MKGGEKLGLRLEMCVERVQQGRYRARRRRVRHLDVDRVSVVASVQMCVAVWFCVDVRMSVETSKWYRS